MYNIELNVETCNEPLTHALKKVGKNDGFEVFNHGSDRLVFVAESRKPFLKLANDLRKTCKFYGVNYMELLNFD